MGFDVPTAVAFGDHANRSSLAVPLKTHTHTHWQGLLPQGGNAHNLLTTADDTDAQRCQISRMAADGKAWRGAGPPSFTAFLQPLMTHDSLFWLE